MEIKRYRVQEIRLLICVHVGISKSNREEVSHPGGKIFKMFGEWESITR